MMEFECAGTSFVATQKAGAAHVIHSHLPDAFSAFNDRLLEIIGTIGIDALVFHSHMLRDKHVHSPLLYR